MNWEKLDLHIENLIPGVVLLAIVMAGWRVPLGTLSGHEGLLVATFISIAYMMGTVASVLSRLLLGVVNRNTLRAPFMRFFLGYRLETENPSRTEINKRFSAVLLAGLSCGNSRVESEVAKQRQIERVLRSILVPAILAIVCLGQHLHWTSLKCWVSAFFAYSFLLVLHAYAEVVIFQEGYRGEQILKKNEKEKNSSQSVAAPV